MARCLGRSRRGVCADRSQRFGQMVGRTPRTGITRHRRKRFLDRQHIVGQGWVSSVSGLRRDRLCLAPLPTGRKFQSVRCAFDSALERVHYAGACARVGRCMRLFVVDRGVWVGGIVLGSTFPNVGVRDEALDLKRWVRGCHARGLHSPWSRHNLGYWNRLQRVVNHARTFVFPEAQGRGLGVRAHRLLLRQGVRHWEARYGEPVAAFDTLCDASDSGLFRRNGWFHAGMTAGFESDPATSFAKQKHQGSLRNNVGLRPTGHRWHVWVRVIHSQAISSLSD